MVLLLFAGFISDGSGNLLVIYSIQCKMSTETIVKTYQKWSFIRDCLQYNL